MGKKNDSPNGKDDNKGSGKIAVIVIVGVIIILLLVIVIILLLKKDGQGTDTEVAARNENTREVAGSVRTIANEDEARTVMDEMREEVAEGMFKCDMPTTWVFKNGGAEPVDLYVANNSSNTHPLYFDVYLEDTEELLYSSPVLRVGTRWTDIKLDKKLDPGEYRVKVAYKLLKDEESQEESSAVNFIVLVNILN
jgi:hypothetical protein